MTTVLWDCSVTLEWLCRLALESELASELSLNAAALACTTCPPRTSLSVAGAATSKMFVETKLILLTAHANDTSPPHKRHSASGTRSTCRYCAWRWKKSPDNASSVSRVILELSSQSTVSIEKASNTAKSGGICFPKVCLLSHVMKCKSLNWVVLENWTHTRQTSWNLR